MAQRSVMVHQFSQVPKAQIPRSSFDRSHGHKLTFDSGYLIPIFTDEVYPGDTFSMNLTAFVRMATPIKPVMDNVHLSTFFFFIPNRLLWQNWQKFMGERINPGDSIDFTVPQIGPMPVQENTLNDYLGLPIVATNSITVNSLFHRAYVRVWNEWFRDQNLQDAEPFFFGDGPDDHTRYRLLKRGKRHDYFTSSLPWPQKGDAVTLPIQTQAPVLGIGVQGGGTANAGGSSVRETGGITSTYTANQPLHQSTPMTPIMAMSGTTDAYPEVYADLTSATATTINELRQAFQIQRMLERDARGGTRYTELVRSHFGVISPDARLQRPEFLGGGHSLININPVTQTSETLSSGGSTPQGNLSAYATGSIKGHGFTKSFTEHGVVLGLVCAHADLTYQQGIDRHFNRRTRYDYYWPSLAQIGEQAVLSKEIYADGTADDDLVWGYQERFAELRYKPSRISGTFRSKASNTLDPWHLSQNFASRPVLNASFIEENPPIDRVLAVANEPQFLFDGYFNLRCARPMPTYGVPGMIDHF